MILRDRSADVERFYQVIEQHRKAERRLGECHDRMDWPRRGVYLLFEPGETRSGEAAGGRVVRIGTHALKPGSQTRYWMRLIQHRGQSSSGCGNHRGSIFRLLVGQALLARTGRECPTWGIGSTAPRAVIDSEAWLEREVSEIIGDFRVLTIPIQDEAGLSSMRGWIERNTIALLSNHEKEAIDSPSPEWLGRHSNRANVRSSGLWNSNHVAEFYDPRFLDDLERYLVEGGFKQ